MQKNILKPVLTIVFVLVVVAGLIFFTKSKSDLVDNPGVTNLAFALEPNINAYMESQKSEDDLGKDNYYCSNLPYGNDEKYIYAWVYCSGFVIKSDGQLELGSGFSGPVRLEYIESEFDIKIVGYQMPNDGEDYGPSLQALFPQEFYEQAIIHPSVDSIGILKGQIEDRVRGSNPERVSGGEKENITTPAYVVGFSTKEGKSFVELDYATKMTAYEYAVERISNDECSLPGMSKAQALNYAKEKLHEPYVNGNRKDIGLFQDNCIDGYISVEFGETINQNPKTRTFPLSDKFKVINSCRDEITLASIKDHTSTGGDTYSYRKYGTGGQFIPKVHITNGIVIDFDFVTGCAG